MGDQHSLEMKEDVDQWVYLLNEHPVVSIWGASGLGKTSMARKVYSHPRVGGRFDAFAWVSLTNYDNVDKIVVNMRDQLRSGGQSRGVLQSTGAEEEQKSGFLMMRGLQVWRRINSFLRSFKSETSVVEKGTNDIEEGILRQKKCFIVFDGVLGNAQWQQIKSAVQFDGTDTRVLITTQHEDTIGDEGVSHELRRLTQAEGWELLQKYVYHRGTKAPEYGILPRLGNEIVGKCGRLPSSICSIGRVLSTYGEGDQIDISKWHELNEHFEATLKRGSSMISNDQIPNRHLVSNYNNLSNVARQCFLYLAIFKEHVDVDIEDLSFLWAEDKLSSQQDATENNIKGLVSSWQQRLQMRILIDELSANGRSERLCLDSHMRDLSLYQGEKEGFGLKVLDISDGNKQPIPNETKILVFHFTKHSSPYGHDLPALLTLSSLFFLNYDTECADLPVNIPDLSAFKKLKIVHFVRCKFQGRRLPQGIENLSNLMHIGLLYCDLDELPPSISNVTNLHVLNVRAHDDAKIKIPTAISQMVRLQHLRLPKNTVLLNDHQQSGKLKLDALLDLETLDGFNADIHDIESLSQLTKLRHLVARAYNNDSLESFIKFFKPHGDRRVETNLFVEYKCDLTSGKGSAILEEVLMCPNLCALTFSMVLINRFPNCGKFASEGITQIKLIGSKLGEDPMAALGMFANLQKLCLGYGAFFGSKMDTTSTGFPKLQYLEFRCLPHLEIWRVAKGAMKTLSTLIITQCPKFKKIPDALRYISSLQKFEIELPPTEPLSKVQESNFRLMFRTVKEFNIRVLDPLSAASSSGSH